MPGAIRVLLTRLEFRLAEEATRGILLDSPHAGAPRFYAEERRMSQSSGSFDECLRRRWVALTEELMERTERRTLFYDQRIEQNVLAFVVRNPEIGGGVRRGNKMHCTKISRTTLEYLQEKN